MTVAVVGTPVTEDVVKSAVLASEADTLVEFHPALPMPPKEERVTADTSETVRVGVMWVVLVTSVLTSENEVEL